MQKYRFLVLVLVMSGWMSSCCIGFWGKDEDWMKRRIEVLKAQSQAIDDRKRLIELTVEREALQSCLSTPK